MKKRKYEEREEGNERKRDWKEWEGRSSEKTAPCQSTVRLNTLLISPQGMNEKQLSTLGLAYLKLK